MILNVSLDFKIFTKKVEKMTFIIAKVIALLFGLAQTQARLLTIDCSYNGPERVLAIFISLNYTQFYTYKRDSGK